MKFHDIYATVDHRARYYFDLDDDIDKYFCTDIIHLYGIPESLSEDAIENIYNGSGENAVYLGEIMGTLILGCQLTQDGYNFWLACDDMSGDLSFVASSLMSSKIIQNDFDLLNDIYYIHEIEMEKKFDIFDLKVRILENLLDMIFKLYNVRPSMLTYYPMPLENSDKTVEEPKHDIAVMVDPAMIDGAVHKTDKIMRMKITDNELDSLLQKDNEPITYPTSEKDPALWDLYQKAGFEEAGQTRLLYKKTEF